MASTYSSKARDVQTRLNPTSPTRHQQGSFPEKDNNTLLLNFNESLKTFFMYSKHVKRGHQIDDI